MHLTTRLLVLSVLAAIAALAPCRPASAGNFGVSPLDVQFSEQRKSAVLTVTSDDPRPVSVRLQAMRWTQDTSGQDHYEPSNDLIFFPKRIDLKAGDRKIVRVGVNTVGQSDEIAYRLFIEEMAPAERPNEAGTKLAVLVSVGIPVFVTPVGFEPEATLSSATLSASGKLSLQVNNAGKSRLRISRISGPEGVTLSEEISSRYVFPGISKRFEIGASATPCKNGLATLGLDAGTRIVDFEARCGN